MRVHFPTGSPTGHDEASLSRRRLAAFMADGRWPYSVRASAVTACHQGSLSSAPGEALKVGKEVSFWKLRTGT